MKNRVVVWFSCGATSAVAAKMAIKKYEGHEIVVAYCDTSSEHEDNKRFLKDVENWLGLPIKILKNEKFNDIWDVFEKRKYIAGIKGAPCTSELKKRMRMEFEDIDDIQIFGFDLAESERVKKFRENNPEVNLDPILFEHNLSKADCLAMLRSAGIEPPITYEYLRNANCLGCPKGQMGYWNVIRKHHPDVFDRMSKLERKLNAAICKTYAGDGKRKRVFLDELDPDAGNYKAEPKIDCGVFCQIELENL